MFSLDILAFIYWIIFIMAGRVVVVGQCLHMGQGASTRTW